MKVSFPFDLNNLFSMQYSFDTLKEAIEFLAQQQADMSQRFDDLNDKFNGLPAPAELGTDIVKEPA